MRLLLSTTVVLMSVVLLLAQGRISVESGVDRSTIRIGDLITYTVRVTRSPEIELESPALAANLGAFEIRDYEVADPQQVNGLVIERFDYTISTFEVGEFEIPPLDFHYRIPDDSTRHLLRTQKIQILVESMVESDAGDIRDIKGPLSLPADYSRYLIWGALGLGMLILAVGAYIFWRKHRRAKTSDDLGRPSRPAHEIALEELRRLRDTDLLENGQIKAYYIRLSEIIRRYIEGRYFITAIEQTTHELIQSLIATEVEQADVERIRIFLESCDLVKFAKVIPPQDAIATDTDRAVEIVEESRLTFEPENGDEPSLSASTTELEEKFEEPEKEAT